MLLVGRGVKLIESFCEVVLLGSFYSFSMIRSFWRHSRWILSWGVYEVGIEPPLGAEYCSCSQQFLVQAGGKARGMRLFAYLCLPNWAAEDRGRTGETVKFLPAVHEIGKRNNRWQFLWCKEPICYCSPYELLEMMCGKASEPGCERQMWVWVAREKMEEIVALLVEEDITRTELSFCSALGKSQNKLVKSWSNSVI